MSKHWNISEENFRRWKDTFAKDGITYETDDEYREAIKNFLGYIEILVEIDKNLKMKPNRDDSNSHQKYYLKTVGK